MASFTPAYFLELYLCESTLMTFIVLEWLYIEVYRLIICMWSKAEARGPKVNLFLSHTVCLYINWCIEIAMLLCNSSECFSHWKKKIFLQAKNDERFHFRVFNMNILYTTASFLGKGNLQSFSCICFISFIMKLYLYREKHAHTGIYGSIWGKEKIYSLSILEVN